MHLLLGCLFTLLFGFVIAIFVIVFNLLKVFFRVKQATRKFTQGAGKTNEQTQTFTHTRQTGERSSTQQPNKKIFNKNEGEYVDFEEVK